MHDSRSFSIIVILFEIKLELFVLFSESLYLKVGPEFCINMHKILLNLLLMLFVYEVEKIQKNIFL